MVRIVDKYDVKYNDLGKIKSQNFGKRYLIQFLNGNPKNYKHTIKNINTFSKSKILKDYEEGRIFVLADTLFSPALNYQKEKYSKTGRYILNNSKNSASIFFNSSLKYLLHTLKPQYGAEVSVETEYISKSSPININLTEKVKKEERTKKLITKEMLEIVASNKKNDNKLLNYLNKFAEKYKINTKNRIAHFLSQIGHESGFNIRSENLNYSEKRMQQIFGCKRKGWKNGNCLISHRKRSKLWDNPNHYARNSQNLANYVYSNRMGNGNESSGDGYRYRGRGIIQLTGKDNYQMFTNQHNNKNPDDLQDFVNNPDLIISNKKYGIESAFVFWENKNLNSIADSENVEVITKLVNGGTNGLADRQKKFNKLIKIIN